MKLDKIEKVYLSKIAAISKLDLNTVRNVLRSTLIMCSIEYSADAESIIIPFIGSIKINTDKRAFKKGYKTDVMLDIEPSKILIDEVVSVSHDEEPPSTKYFKNQIQLNLSSILDVDQAEEKEDV